MVVELVDGETINSTFPDILCVYPIITSCAHTYELLSMLYST